MLYFPCDYFYLGLLVHFYEMKGFIFGEKKLYFYDPLKKVYFEAWSKFAELEGIEKKNKWPGWLRVGERTLDGITGNPSYTSNSIFLFL